MSRFPAACLFTVAVLAGPGIAVAAEPPQKTKDVPAAPALSPEQQQMMEAWQKAAEPGDEHRRLAALAGRWKMTVTMWHEPGKDPEVTRGANIATMVMGGRFLEERITGSVLGRNYHGVSLTGFDNVKKKYTALWYDNLNTAMVYTEGQREGENRWVFTGESVDPMTGKPAPLRLVFVVENADRRTFEMYGTGPDGKEVKMMAILYERAGKPSQKKR